MQFVLDDRAAEGRTVLPDGISGESGVVAVPGEPLALKVAEHRAVELVGTTLGNRVHQATSKVALPDIEGGNLDDNLLNRLDGKRLRVGVTPRCALRGQAEKVVVRSAVDLDVVVSVVLTGDRNGATLVCDDWVCRNEVGEVT